MYIDRGAHAARLRVLRARARSAPRFSDKLLANLLKGPPVVSTGSGAIVAPRGGGGLQIAAAVPPTLTANAPVTRNIPRDLAALASGPFIGGYELGAGAVDVARGRGTGRLERLGKGVLEGFSHSAPGELLIHGDPKAALEDIAQHPVMALLDFSAVGAVAGRTAGGLARGAGEIGAPGVRGALAKAGSRVRPPLALTDDPAGPLVERNYSSDLMRKSGQAARDRAREPLLHPDGSPVMHTQAGRQVPVLKASQAEIEGGLLHDRAGLAGGQANFEAGRANALERSVREQAGHEGTIPGPARAAVQRAADHTRRLVLRDAQREVRAHGIRGRKARNVVLLVAGGTIRSAKTFSEDLRAWRDGIAEQLRHHEAHPEETQYRHRGELQMARENVALADKLLERAAENPELVKRIVAAGIATGKRLNETERELLRTGVLSSVPRATRARVIHAAVQHLGARHFTEADLAEMERQGVSVREPRQEAAHQTARAEHAAARTAHRDAQARVKQLSDRRARLVGAQASRRGRRQADARGRAITVERGPRPEGRATAAEARKLQALTGELSKARRAERTARQALRKAKRKLDSSPRPPLRDALRGPDGRFLSTEEIKRRVVEGTDRDPETIAYVPNETTGARAFHQQFRPGTRPVMDKPGVRTGAQYRKGATETTADILREHGIRQRTQLVKARQLDRLVESSGMKRPDGQHFTNREALEMAERVDIDTRSGLPVLTMRNGQRLVPMRAFAAKLSPETRRIVDEELQGPGAMETLHLRLLNDRVAGEADMTARNVVLVPAKKVEQLERHLRPAGELEKFGQLLNRPFRMAVLPQPRWLTGNFVEPYIVRLTGVGSGLNVFGLGADMVAATRALRAMERSADPRVRWAAAEIRAHQFGGLFVGGGYFGAVRRGLEDFPKLERMYGRMVARMPLTAQTLEMTGLALHYALAPLRLFFHVNRAIEKGAQRAAFGHQFRKELHEFTGSWTATIRLQQKAVEEAAQGLVNTPTQERFMRAQHELLGQYDSFGPVKRRWVQSVAPFLPWALNAARFVFWTMPVHRTIQTALLMKVNDTVAKTWQEEHANVPPGGLKFALPTERGGWVDVARYTPWGLTAPIVAAAEGSPKTAAQPITDQFLPQFSGAAAAVGGSDPFGKALQVDPRERGGRSDPTFGEQLGIAGYGLAESLVPYLSTVRRLREGGGTAYGGSTVFDPDVKPGSKSMSAARRVFDPFRPTYLGAPSQRSGPRQPRGPVSQQDRIDAALERLDQQDALDAAQEDRISRALARLGP